MPNYEKIGTIRTVAAAFVLSFCIDISLACSQQSEIDSHHVSVEKITKDQLVEDIMSRDKARILETLSSIQTMPDYEYLFPDLRDLWAEKESKYPDLPWHMINSDEIKIELAILMLNASSVDSAFDLKKEIGQFLRALVNSPNRIFAAKAIVSLAQLREESDVELLYSIALEPDSTRFRSAVVGLATMCLPSAERALDSLETEIVDVDIRHFIENTRAEFRGFRASNRWCR
jgi:hypothetical protein